MRFADVMHQARPIQQIQRALLAGRVAHAYLFAGPEGVGREMLAMRCGATLLCAEPVRVPAVGGDAAGGNATAGDAAADEWLDACGRCEDCQLFAAGNHPDYHRIHRALNRHHPKQTVRARKAIDLSVDVIRHFLLDQIGYRPARGRAKVFVVAESERLSPGAQNAMLKTLEEPPGASHLFLIATSPDALLATTRSRCQLVSFGPLPVAFVAGQIADQCGVDPDSARFLAEYSGGSLGAGIRAASAGLFGYLPVLLKALDSVADDPLAFGRNLLELTKTVAKDAKDAMSAQDEDDGDGEPDTDKANEESVPDAPDTSLIRQSQMTVFALLAAILRDVQRVAVGQSPAALRGRRELDALAAQTTPRAIGQAVRAVANAEYQINRSANIALTFDALGIALGRAMGGSVATAGV